MYFFLQKILYFMVDLVNAIYIMLQQKENREKYKTHWDKEI